MAGDSATIILKGENKQLKQTLSKSEDSVKKFGSTVKKVFVAIAAVVAARKIFSAMSKFIELAGEQENAEARLRGVIRATGMAAGFTAEQLIAEAAALQKITTFGDEAVIGMQSVLATFKEIKGDVFIEATKAIADMSAELGTDLKSSAIQVGKALNDPIKGVAALTRSGVSFTEQQKKMIKSFQESGDIISAQKIILQELKGEFGGVAEEMAKTATGQLKQYQNRMSDLGEEIGKRLGPVLLRLTPIIEKVANFFVDKIVPAIGIFIEAIGDAVGVVRDSFAPTIQRHVNAAIETFTVFQTAILDWKEILSISFKSVQLSFVKSFNVIIHFLTVVVPEAAVFFANNFLDVLRDIAVGAATIFENIGKNALEALKAPFKAIAGEPIEFVGLLEGFEAVTKEFPEVAARVRGALERELEFEIGVLEEGLAKRVGERLDFNRKIVAEIFKDKGAAASRRPGQATRPQDIKLAPDLGFILDVGEKKPVLEAVIDFSSFTSSIEGLTALNQRITTAAASRREEDDPLFAKMAELVKQGVGFNVREEKQLGKIIDLIDQDKKISFDQNELLKRFLDSQGLQ